MLIDTDVLIWMTRGHAGAAAKLQTMMPWRISAVTYMELVQGCRNKDELMRIKKGLAMCQTEILPVSAAVSNRAMQLIDTYALSHSLQLGDALIAATALEYSFTVLTANTKHFNPIGGLHIETFVP
ncbi:MAG: twitching motility protein PilT [Burkholderiales bacterium RIFOXYC12_FULL_60_6]|nr:MAG: twitching motility protein PilT [Burkholderiales bacterium RIFOXYC12_FULL_60_6]